MAITYRTTAGGGLFDGSSWANAFSLANHIAHTYTAGDVEYIKEGTYTLTANINKSDPGSLASMITQIGVKAATTNEPPLVSDWSPKGERPLFTGGNYQMKYGVYTRMLNLDFVLGSSPAVWLDFDSEFYNGFVHNETGSIGVKAKNVFNSQCLCTNGAAAQIDPDGLVYNSYFHDSIHGIECFGNNIEIIKSIMHDCTDGIEMSAFHDVNILMNTINGCVTGINGTSGYGVYAIDNTISDCTDGIKFTAHNQSNWVTYNNFYNCVTDVTNIDKNTNNISVDPQFTSAATGDFTLKVGSLLRNAAMPLENGVG